MRGSEYKLLQDSGTYCAPFPFPHAQLVTYEPKPVRGMHPDPLGAVGKSFWEDVIGTLLPWEVEKEKAPIPNPASFVGVGITFRRDLNGALLIHQIMQVCPLNLTALS